MYINELLNALISNGTLVITIIGLLAFTTSVITQVTKSWGVLNRIPTALLDYIISLFVTVFSVCVYVNVNDMDMVWYYIAGAVILSFFVAFVTTNGWKQLKEIWNRIGKLK